MQPHNRLEAEAVPPLPEDVTPDQLARPLARKLAGLGKENSNFVACHLVMAQDLLQDEPELAYRHARAAADRAARVDIAREFAGLTSYFTGRFAEATRELRTFQRLSGTKHHLPLVVDAMRAIGQGTEAIDLAVKAKPSELDPDEWFELGLVLAGARADQGQFEAALAQLARLRRACTDPALMTRLDEAQTRIEALADGQLVEDEVTVLYLPNDGVIDWLDLDPEADQPEPADDAAGSANTPESEASEDDPVVSKDQSQDGIEQ